MSKFSLASALSFIKLFFARLFIINDTPQKIALGFGLGVFLGILPVTGPIAALFLAMIFKVNRAAALLASLLTNTWLSFVTFILAIKIGSCLFGVSWLSLRESWVLATSHWHWQNLFDLPFLDIILPIVAGYIIISLVLGIISYGVVLGIIKKRRACTP